MQTLDIACFVKNKGCQCSPPSFFFLFSVCHLFNSTCSTRLHQGTKSKATLIDTAFSEVFDEDTVEKVDLLRAIQFLLDGYGRTCAASHEAPTTADVERLTMRFREHLIWVFGEKEKAKEMNFTINARGKEEVGAGLDSDDEDSAEADSAESDSDSDSDEGSDDAASDAEKAMEVDEPWSSDEPEHLSNAKVVLNEVVKHLMLTGLFFDNVDDARLLVTRRIYTKLCGVTHARRLDRSLYHHILYDLALVAARMCHYCLTRRATVCDENARLKSRNCIKGCKGKSVSQVAESNTVTTSDFAKCLFGLTDTNHEVVPNIFSCTECNTRKGVTEVVLFVDSNGDRFLIVFQVFKNGRMRKVHFVYQVGGELTHDSEEIQTYMPPVI